MNKYLKNGEVAYTVGAYIIWNDHKQIWELEEVDGDIMCDGQDVYFDDSMKPYTN